MAEGPITTLADVIVPAVFTPYSQLITAQKSRLIQSGLAGISPALSTLLAGGGLTFNVPSFRDLDEDVDRTPTDSSEPFAGPRVTAGGPADPVTLPAGQAYPPNPRKTGTLREIAVRIQRNNSWSSSDLAAVLAGADPMNSIAERVGYYWTRRLQAAFIATWTGVIADNTANDAGDYSFNISGASFVDGVTNFSAEAFIDACLTMGDSMEDITTMCVHSVVYSRMQKNNLIDFIPDARGEINIPTFLGRQVIVDDGMPRTGQVYDTWLFGAGATQLGIGTPPTATETDRRPGAGNGGGQDVLYSRVMWCIHPTGHAWVGSSTADGGPPNSGSAGSDLNEAASWDRRFTERKQIKFARLVSREA